MPSPGNLNIYQGDDYAATVTVFYINGLPADLTGYTAQSQIRNGPADQDPIVLAEIVATVVPPNQVTLVIPGSVTTGLSGGSYAWDLQLTSPSGAITTIMAGSAISTSEITREP
jgi:hypothetical protein